MNMKFEIDDLKVTIGGVDEIVYVSGELEFSVHSEGQEGTYWDPPMDDDFGVDCVYYEDILRTSDVVLPKPELEELLDEAVKGWFEGPKGQDLLQSQADAEKDSSYLEYQLYHMSFDD